jgi:hypothetical protein
METVDAKTHPSNKNVTVMAHEEKDSDGNVAESQKTFFLKNGTELIGEILAAFEKDKPNAYWIQETNGTTKVGLGKKGRNLLRMYSFKVGEKGVVHYQFVGASKKIKQVRFVRSYAADNEARIRKSEIMMRRSTPSSWTKSEGARVVNSISIDGPTEHVEMSDGLVMTIKRDDDGTVTWAVKEQ